MNRRMILYVMGIVLKSEGALMFAVVAVALIYRETREVFAFALPAIVLIIVGLFLTRRMPENQNFFAKDGFVVVAFSWIIISVAGAIPLYLSGDIPLFIDCIFESVSGFTTTGSTILNNVDAISHAVLFWRSFTHLIGGMGILVFVLLIMPKSSGNSIFIMRAEMPGVHVEKLVAKVGPTVRVLYFIYLGMTALLILLLVLAGMPFFDAIINAMSTAGTGGFSLHQDSVAHYNSALIEAILTLFMLLFSINFNIYFLILIGKVKSALKSEELKWFMTIVSVAIALITLNTLDFYGGDVVEAFRYTAFQVASLISTTGFATFNYDLWPEFSKTILLLLMFAGACAGSTGGGFKTSRLVILLKAAYVDFKHIIHPRRINTIKFEGQTLEPMVLKGANAYFMGYMLLLIASTLLISIESRDFLTNLSSVVTCLSNVGPGFNFTGPTMNFSGFSVVSKLILCFDMLAGRLEIFPMLILFSPFTWRK